MPRIRSIKPEILDDDKTSSLPSREWRAFVSLITLADDHGHVRANPRWLVGQIFWATPENVDIYEVLARLSRDGLITLYSNHNQPFLHVTNWKRHQKVDHPAKPRMPQLGDHDGSFDWDSVLGTPLFPTSSRIIRETLATDLGPRTQDLGSRTEEHATDRPREDPRGVAAVELGGGGSSSWSNGQPLRKPSDLILLLQTVGGYVGSDGSPDLRRHKTKLEEVFAAGTVPENDYAPVVAKLVAKEAPNVGLFLVILKSIRDEGAKGFEGGIPTAATDRATEIHQIWLEDDDIDHDEAERIYEQRLRA